MPIELIQPLSQFGSAGLVGALWVCERFLSRRRDRELTEAHDRLMQERHQLRALLRLVRQNTAAIEGFAGTQARLIDVLTRLENMVGAMRDATAMHPGGALDREGEAPAEPPAGAGRGYVARGGVAEAR